MVTKITLLYFRSGDLMSKESTKAKGKQSPNIREVRSLYPHLLSWNGIEGSVYRTRILKTLMFFDEDANRVTWTCTIIEISLKYVTTRVKTTMVFDNEIGDVYYFRDYLVRMFGSLRVARFKVIDFCNSVKLMTTGTPENHMSVLSTDTKFPISTYSLTSLTKNILLC